MKVSAVLALAAGAIAAPVAPGVPSASTARSELASLTVADQVDDGNYSRSQFKTWDIIHDKCNTRDVVLIRDGTDVQTNDRCTVGTGNWVSPYDDAQFTQGHDLDIDHLVPLKNAWVSGASNWTAKQREAFANDLDRPQLWAVSEHANRSKGDKGPEEYMPPSDSFKCTYAESWVQVKSHYGLTITSAEQQALQNVLSNC